MLIRELIRQYSKVGGSVYSHGVDQPPAEFPTGCETREYAPSCDVGAADLLLVRAGNWPPLRTRIPMALPVGTRVVVLLDVEVGQVPVGRVVSALACAGLQVVAAFPIASFATPCTAVVSVRSDELVVPEPLQGQIVSDPDLSDTERLCRIVSEHVLDRLVRPAREQRIANELGELRVTYTDAAARLETAEPDAADLPNVRLELAAARTRIRQIEESETWRLAQMFARASATVRRRRHRSLRAGGT